MNYHRKANRTRLDLIASYETLGIDRATCSGRIHYVTESQSGRILVTDSPTIDVTILRVCRPMP